MNDNQNQPSVEIKTTKVTPIVPLTAPEVTPVAKDILPKTKKNLSKKETVKKEDKSEFDTAMVMNGKIEIRKYTLKDHGENFIKLANEFANKKGYKVIAFKEVIKTDIGDGIKEDPENVVIVKKNGLTIRTYSLGVHGENFKELAAQFAKKNNYQI